MTILLIYVHGFFEKKQFFFQIFLGFTFLLEEVVTRSSIMIKQNFLERTNPPTFLTTFTNAAITLKKFGCKVLNRGHTDGQKVK
jgi:hypothetical protein